MSFMQFLEIMYTFLAWYINVQQALHLNNVLFHISTWSMMYKYIQRCIHMTWGIDM